MSFPTQQETRSKRVIKYDHTSYACPLGMPETSERVLSDMSIFTAAPDPQYTALRRKIAAFEGTKPENIVCGNSTAELVFRTVVGLRPKKALICAPTDSEYKRILLDNGCEIAEYRLPQENSFALTTEFADFIDRDTDMVIVCSPNYPTGELITPYTLGRIAARCRENNTILICDERYLQLIRGSEKFSAKRCAGPHIIVLRSISDSFGLAGLGLAYGVFAADRIAEIVSSAGHALSIPTPAQLAGAAALDDKVYLKRAARILTDERKYLSEELTRIGIMVYPSQANFLLFRCELPLDELLAKRGIRIRSFADIAGLGEGYFGIAVRRRSDNKRIVAEIEHILRVREYISI
ncbi:MAG: aminotransferase class I/II-fold pyridoxal phosphate-dependent enzyme [Ruminococcus sp.]|nr:aminotransferase class I/II-fold pyridoxal phosphate-dependent enzyme [Ruminococcus sp.]